MLLFGGDAEHAAGRLRGEEPREEAAIQLRRMRQAFDEAVDEAEKSSLPDDLKQRAFESKETSDATPKHELK